ncbi:glycoside hydrolase family 3 N-terminal domain-containing protein [Prauserella rugosa]|uniref:beta-N-acetylhexosaminidase n=1 Tax=Prauserella rugosa TaxID=43354 RepID=A0A660CHP0_9PSEU|nr:glycoside hydrolase family 3 protein [Prauserella rugosa]KMS90441.1 beta-glucosidase [Streptomyces regensis]TWH21934.1 beta-N-acetylhexosaminidase [Prauserella rugosa]
MRKRLLFAAMSGLLVAGCGSSGTETQNAPSPGSATSEAPSSSVAPSAQSSAQKPDSGATCPAAADMSPREKVAQLVVVGVETGAEETQQIVRDEQIGGLFVGGNATDLFTSGALKSVQDVADVPVSIAIDDEGGRVQRLDELVGDMPSAREMAQTMSPQEVRQLAVERGREMRERGVTVDYAPDVDLTDEPASEAIGDRSFSTDPATAREYAKAFGDGLQEAGIKPVIKHFPGHGNASGDSHVGDVTTPPLSELRNHDLKPYERIGEYGDVGVMVGHLTVPGLTEDQPASISPAAYKLLRDDYSFNGPVVTDDLGAMKAITDRHSLPDAVLLALKAGADQALWSSGGNVAPVLDRLEKAVRDGELSQERVDTSLTRVLRAKDACGA